MPKKKSPNSVRIRNSTAEFLIFTAQAGEESLEVRYEDETIWLTDAKIGYEFPKKKGSINLECRNIFNQHFNWVTDYFVFNGRVPTRETLLTLSFNF